MRTELAKAQPAMGLLRLAVALAAAPMALPAQAAAPTTAPQVLLVVTNSESMDGTTSGAIMVGSGGLATANNSLQSSSSPKNYSIPTGFTPPLNVGASGVAPYTVTCGAYQCDNGPSRLNLAKSSIKTVINTYASTLNFGVYTYSVSGIALYSTWVYHMSPAGGFVFTNSASTSTVDNPCYKYQTGTANVLSNCGSISTKLYGAATLNSNAYMAIGATSDLPAINDVLYAPANYGLPAVFVTYGTVSPANPYTAYTLNTYKTNLGGFSVSYGSTVPSVGGWATTPTNAGYVPYSSQVMYAQRGWGYGASQSATTGSVAVPMGTDPATAAFTDELAPETSNPASGEMKAAAGQSAIGGILAGAKTYMSGLPKTTCQSQYVVLLTDGLPTLDKSGYAWPPLGTTTANQYGLTATFNADGSLASTNSQAVQDAINSVTALYAAGIKTYVIGLGAGVDAANNPMAAKVLRAMAVAGHTTDFFPATNPVALTDAFSTIANQIYNETAVTAPVAPISVAGGDSLVYQMTSFQAPMAGHVKAYKTAADGTIAASASWDVGDGMNVANRSSGLRAAKAATGLGPVTTLASVDAAAFGLTATTCVPTTATVVSYTINPSAVPVAGCSYLGGRKSGWFLGAFSTQNNGKYVSRPASGTLSQTVVGYVAYAASTANRPNMLLYTSNDGFLYASDPKSGALLWGWTSTSLLSKMQNYSTFQSTGATNGGFTVVDAVDGSGAWGSYLVGSFQSGAEHFSVKLDASGIPQNVVYDKVDAGYTSPGDVAGTVGSVPMRQNPVVRYANGTAYYMYVSGNGGNSTLYTVNVATGVATSFALGFQVSSAMYYDAARNSLWLGGADGSVWLVTITDAGYFKTQLFYTRNPVTGASYGPVLYAGYGEVAGVPYAYAVNASQLTVYGIKTTGWTPLWATTATAGYQYKSGAFSVNASQAVLTSGGVVSDQPMIVGSVLLLPMYVPAASVCEAGRGAYDLFELGSGLFPTSTQLAYRNGTAITGHILLPAGSGPAWTPSLTAAIDGLVLNPTLPPGGGGTTNTQMVYLGRQGPGSWRQR